MAAMPTLPTQEQLLGRFQALQQRIQAVEAAAELFCRFRAISNRLDAVEQAASQAPAGTPPPVPDAAAAEAAAAASRQAAYEAAQVDASPIQARLAQELFDKGFSDFRFVRVPGDYYDRPLEWRQACLAAASTDHLCKSIIMENTKAHPSVKGWEDPNNSKYYVVIVQYTARLNADKLKNIIHRLNGGRIGKQYFNMRLCPEDVSDELSGYEHNAVSPIGIKAPLPVILSHRIAQLQPDFFFIGAGEVDLKVGLPAAEFIEKYTPMVLDCTYDDE
ncbi:hypothetical protein OEZ85_007174 [Tetradesmus obliquus]|uniref:YbaK/aminoacyl-tRNA synthetase-associated domain-containing protein n=1 Tax=Tetradesmus obliquus TaxID=3088 RepID=A0ABY8TXL0_TETOB|nr:hypothetical protein OEZ85_007174 [Tetradesmus obliquus]